MKNGAGLGSFAIILLKKFDGYADKERGRIPLGNRYLWAGMGESSRRDGPPLIAEFRGQIAEVKTLGLLLQSDL